MLNLAHGSVNTPIFMPVGTQAVVKALSSFDLQEIGYNLILANTYHTYLRPGEEVLKSANGVHNFANFKGNFLSDSGGFQAFSLGGNVKFKQDGISFKSHIDGSTHFFTPKKVIDIQYALNSDIMMVLDYLIGLPATNAKILESIQTTTRWAKLALEYHFQNRQEGRNLTNNLFAIMQGGTHKDFRKQSIISLLELEDKARFEGFAIGGLAVGETKQEMYETLESCVPFMPKERPRYLMGVGTPENILEAISRGVDMFDCVMPTRNARNASIFTLKGRINIKSSRYKFDFNPLEEGCSCLSCKSFTRSYLHHLFRANELTYHRLASIHNLTFYLRLVTKAREAILQNNFEGYKKQVLSSLDS